MNTAVVDIGGGLQFPILGGLTVTVPGTGSESWEVNTTQTIEFTKKGDLQTVDLYYSFDGTGPNYAKITSTPIDISDATGGTPPYSFDWFLDPASTTLTSGFVGTIKAVAVTPAEQTSVEDVQSNTIEVKGNVTILAPGGATDPGPGIVMVRGGLPYTISWARYGVITNVDIQYSDNGGSTYDHDIFLNFDTTSNTTHNWTIPDDIDNDLLIRVRDSNNHNVDDVSNNVFEIRGSLQLDVPDTTITAWYIGNTYSIQWTPTGTYSGSPFPNVEFHYANDGNYTNAVLPDSELPNTANAVQGSGTWLIPDAIGTGYRVRVSVVGSPTTVESITSRADGFKILGTIDAISSPSSGEVWYVGETKLIQWSNTGTITNVKIEYKTSSGGAWIVPAIVDNDGGHAAGNNSYEWSSVADVKTEDAYIQVSDANYPEVVLASADFRIRPQIIVDDIKLDAGYDNGLMTGSTYTNVIKWSYTGSTISFVEIYYDDDEDGTFDEVIADSVNNPIAVAQGSTGVSWSIPNGVNLTSLARVRIVDAGNANVLGTSATFKLRGGLTLSAPVGGATWTAESTINNIAWNFSGSISTVNVYYDLNDLDGDDWTLIDPVSSKAQSGTSGASVISWEIPATVTNNARIRIEDAADATDTESISSLFNISGLNIFNRSL